MKSLRYSGKRKMAPILLRAAAIFAVLVVLSAFGAPSADSQPSGTVPAGGDNSIQMRFKKSPDHAIPNLPGNVKGHISIVVDEYEGRIIPVAAIFFPTHDKYVPTIINHDEMAVNEKGVFPLIIFRRNTRLYL